MRVRLYSKRKHLPSLKLGRILHLILKLSLHHIFRQYLPEILNIHMRLLTQLPQGLDIDGLGFDIGCSCAKGKPGECFVEEGSLKDYDFGEMEEVINRKHF